MIVATIAGLALAVGTPSVGAALSIRGSTVRASAVAGSTVVKRDAGREVAFARAPRLPAGTVAVGPLAADQTIRGVVGLTPRSAAALGRFASAIATPSSPAYHRYLSAGTFDQYFSPSVETVAAVESHLRADGVTVSSVSSNRLLVNFEGRAAAVAAAFHTTFAAYRLADGRSVFANTATISLPASIASSVAAVVGLDNLSLPEATPLRPATNRRGSAAERAAALHRAQTAASTPGGPVACKTATRTAGEEDGLTDTQIAHAYGVDGLYKTGSVGAGQSVAVYELEPYRTVDIKGFDNCYFGAAAASTMVTRLHTVAVDGGDPTGPGSAESELDIDDVSALAPGATIQVYEAPLSNAGALDDWNAIVSDDTAKTVTSSWGSGCETETATDQPGLEQVENTIFEQAAVQGQTVLNAAGDAGADGCAEDSATPVTPLLSAEDPASQPYVTAVGGTTLDAASDPPVEQPWNDGAGNGAGGGGISAVWAQPSWQAASTVPGMDATKVIKAAEQLDGNDFCQNATVKTACRELPDVSANADEYTGITIEYDGQWGVIGGTSSSTPLWAAMLADIDSTPACGAQGVGFVSPALYAIASVPAEYKASFNDIAAGSNDQFGVSGLYPATKGYDMATGLGSPRVTGPGGVRGLAYYLCTAPTTARPTVSAISPQVISSAAGSGTGPAGAPVTLTITGSHFESTAGVPDVAGVTVGTYQVAPFTVVNASTITATLPLGVAGEGNGGPGDGAGVFDVAVTLTGGLTSVPTAAARLTVYHDPSHTGRSVPVVDAVTPSGGNEAGGTVMHIYGSGFTAQSLTSTVTIGGVTAQVTSATDTQLTVVVPPYVGSGGSATTCASFDASPTTDVCQTQVQVTNINGPSVETPILPENEGSYGEPVAGKELVAATTEFDYLPTPNITGYTFTDPAQAYASEEGISFISFAENEVIVTGTGLGELGFQWADVGTPGTAATADDEAYSVSSTSIDMLLPPVSLTDHSKVEPLAIQTLGSPNQASLTSSEEPSNTYPVTYAPVPKLASISTASGKDLGPSAGGTKITVKGVGFYDDPLVAFTNEDSFGSGTEYDLDFSKSSPHTEFSVVTTAQLAGEDAFGVCTVSGCSGDQETCIPGECIIESGGGHFTFGFYPPGRPSLRSIAPGKGRASEFVTITGTNLDLPQAVYFGSTKARQFGNGFQETGAIDPTTVYAIVPRGLPLGQKVDIRVVTAESDATRPAHPKTPINKAVTFTLTQRVPKPKK